MEKKRKQEHVLDDLQKDQKVIHNNPLILSQKQQDAIQKITDYLKEPYQQGQIFTLQGAGGVGKTTIIKKALTDEEPLFLAPTHKATRILSQCTKKIASTIASALFITLDQTTGKFKPNYQKRKYQDMPIQNKLFTVIVIDECSMVSDELLKEIMSYSTVKIIAMGDKHQLPPINQGSISKMFSSIRAELTEPVRQKKDSSIYILAQQIVTNLKRNVKQIPKIYSQIFVHNENRGVIVIQNDFDLFMEMYQQDFKNNEKGTKFVTYTNENHSHVRSVGSLNSLIKAKDTLSSFKQNDIIMCINASQPCPVQNADEFRVQHISSVSQFTLGKDKIEIQDYILQGIDDQKEIKMKIPTILGYQQLKLKLDYLANQKNWPEYYGIQGIFPTFVRSYALTAQRAQGSTYRNVYVALDNIQLCPDPNTLLKTFYTAVTRASDKLVIFSPDDINTNQKYLFDQIDYQQQNSHMTTNK